jgi:hypothetical protein
LDSSLHPPFMVFVTQFRRRRNSLEMSIYYVASTQ